MIYSDEYRSPLGTLTIACDEEAIVGVWFEGQKYYGAGLLTKVVHREEDLIKNVKKWLDVYFSQQEPDFMPLLKYDATPFRKVICDIMLTIPYGKTMTYGEIAKEAAKRLGVSRMSAQAVGGAVGRNPISIIIPCHRVVGSDGSLTGYAGGIDVKRMLLEIERTDMSGLYVPYKNP